MPLFSDDVQHRIKDLIIQAHVNRAKATYLMDSAVRAVEIALELDEKAAITYLKSEE